MGRVSMCVGLGYMFGPSIGSAVVWIAPSLNRWSNFYWQDMLSKPQRVAALVATVIYAVDFALVWCWLPESTNLAATDTCKCKGSNAMFSAVRTACSALTRTLNDLRTVLADSVLTKIFVCRFLLDVSYLSFRDTFSLYLQVNPCVLRHLFLLIVKLF